MALGAFASKTVACTLETWQVRVQASVLSKTTREGLGKGNFWLFCDISGWHWYYLSYPDSFDMCLDSRNSDNFVPAIKSEVKKLPWNVEALPKIRNMAVSKEVRAGFVKVKEFEGETNPRRRASIQLAHLLEIANHEQGVILQPPIYDDPAFTRWLSFQRSAWINWASPNLELVFTSACSTDAAEMISTAPSEIRLEDFKSRMNWITKAADKFHRLMQDKNAYMEGEIGRMAQWVRLTSE